MNTSNPREMLAHSDPALTRDQFDKTGQARGPVSRPDDSLAWPLACIVAFVLGAAMVMVVALIAKADSLKDQLQREREAPRVPAVVIVERQVNHE